MTMILLSLTFTSTKRRSISNFLEHSRFNPSQEERERSPQMQPHVPISACIPIDRNTRKVSAITATTNMVDLTCAPCAHTPIKKLIAEGAALAAIKDGKSKDLKRL